MPEAAPSALPDDPALLRIEGPIATMTLNRPAAFNSIDLVDREKARAARRRGRRHDDIRVLVIEGEGRAFCAGGDLQTIGAAAAPIRRAGGRRTAEALSRLYHRAPAHAQNRAGKRAWLGRRRRPVARLCRRPLHRRRGRAIYAGLWQDRRLARRRRHGRRGADRRRPPRAADLSRRGQFFGTAGL